MVMAIIFHEGLPGSGKSYEAMRTIVRHLDNGRRVTGYMEGFDAGRIASYLKKPESYVRNLLTVVNRDDVTNIFDFARQDDFIVIDEVQNFWPATRERLPEAMIQSVTEHRHLGQDILIMGQDHRDCHSLWKRRIDKKLNFLKLDALGSSTRYRWIAEQQINGRWSKVGGKTEKYDKAFFGLYRSHESGTDNKSDYKDGRFTVWRSPLFKIVIPAVLLGVYFAISFLVGFFSPPEPVVPPVIKSVPVAAARSVSPAHSAKVMPSVPVSDPSAVVVQPVSFVGGLASSYRPRLSGLVHGGGKILGYVEFLDGSYRVKDRLSFKGLLDLGWDIEVLSYGVLLTQGDQRHIVTSWPIDPFGAVAQHTRSSPSLTTTATGGAGTGSATGNDS